MARKGRTIRVSKTTRDPDRKEFLGSAVEGEKKRKGSDTKGITPNISKGENSGTSNK